MPQARLIERRCTTTKRLERGILSKMSRILTWMSLMKETLILRSVLWEILMLKSMLRWILAMMPLSRKRNLRLRPCNILFLFWCCSFMALAQKIYDFTCILFFLFFCFVLKDGFALYLLSSFPTHFHKFEIYLLTYCSAFLPL